MFFPAVGVPPPPTHYGQRKSPPPPPFPHTHTRCETLFLEEEGVAVNVPVGAELIRSPATAHLYRVRWCEAEDGVGLRIRDYAMDPVSRGGG